MKRACEQRRHHAEPMSAGFLLPDLSSQHPINRVPMHPGCVEFIQQNSNHVQVSVYLYSRGSGALAALRSHTLHLNQNLLQMQMEGSGLLSNKSNQGTLA